MDILATLRRSGGIETLSRRLEVAPADAGACSEALVPAIVAGLRSFVESHGPGDRGLSALVELLERLGGGELAAGVMAPGAVDTARGKAVLQAIFGSADASRAVAARTALGTRVEYGVLVRALPLLAMLIGGYVAARVRGSGAEGSGGLATLAGILASDEGAQPSGDPADA